MAIQIKGSRYSYCKAPVTTLVQMVLIRCACQEALVAIYPTKQITCDECKREHHLCYEDPKQTQNKEK
jgi:hypothetical protein